MPIIYILEVAIGIGLLIFVHELGHFVVAKLSGVTVEKFSLGFGPELVGVTRGDTRYSLRVLPLGGYVKMLGDEPGTDEASLDKSFLAQPFGKKAAIVVAGAFMNIVAALLLFIVVFQIGMTFPAASIGIVEYGSPAYYGGLRPGDRISEINGQRDVDFSDVLVTGIMADPGKPIEMVIERNGEKLPVTVYPDYIPAAGRGYLGIGQLFSTEIAAIEKTVPQPLTPKASGASAPGSTAGATAGEAQSPALAAGVSAGDTIVAVDGREVSMWSQLQRFITANGLKPFTVTVRNDGQVVTRTITPVRDPGPSLGVEPTRTNQVLEVTKGSLAEKMGLTPGDTIAAVGGTRVATLQEIRNAITTNLRSPGALTVERAGGTVELSWPEPPKSGMAFIGDIKTRVDSRIAYVYPDTPGDVIGLKPGDIIAAVNGRPAPTYDDAATLIEGSAADTISITWRRDSAEMTGAFQPAFTGIIPMAVKIERKLPFFAAARLGVKKSWDFASQVYILIKKAVTGQAGIAKNLSGPVGIVHMSYKTAERSTMDLLFFLALISVNLGVVNLLPIPILDGGLLALFAVEKIKGSPLNPKVLMVVQYVGLALIIALFLFVTGQDILRLIKGF